VIEFDTRLTQKLRIAEQKGLVRTLSVFLAHSGDSWFWLAGLALMWLLGNQYWKYRALVLFIAIVLTAFVVFVVKNLFRRKRPEGEWGQFYRITDPHSFPSGHTVRAVMLTVIMLGLGPLWFGLILLVWAPLVGLARIAMGVHYLTDVLAGGVLGLIVGGVVLLIV
jgi:undecaprenyl-diphosphatase